MHPRPLLALVAVLALMAAPASAQTAPSYDLEQVDGQWVHTHVVTVNGTTTYTAQDGLTLFETTPSGVDARITGDTVTVNTTEETVVTLRFHGPTTFVVPTAGAGMLRVETDGEVQAPKEPTARDEDARIYDAQPGETYTVVPAQQGGNVTTTVTTTVPGGPIDATDGFDWMAAVLGLLAGVLLWAFLVQRGMVQRRSRKQVVSESSHATAAAEGPEMLEARQRTLMAALKDLEKAKMNKEVSEGAYDRLKAELKKQMVVVMRALESTKQ